jgi:hypothetical protein
MWYRINHMTAAVQSNLMEFVGISEQEAEGIFGGTGGEGNSGGVYFEEQVNNIFESTKSAATAALTDIASGFGLSGLSTEFEITYLPLEDGLGKIRFKPIITL